MTAAAAAAAATTSVTLSNHRSNIVLSQTHAAAAPAASIDQFPVLMAANDLDGAGKPLAVQILANQLVEIGRVAVRDQKTREHPQCGQNLLLGIEDAEMHAEAVGVLHPAAVARMQVMHGDDRITADLQR